jgi:hypothetical protein
MQRGSFRGHPMKKIGFLLMVGVATLSVSGCLYRRMAGPCYGVGCPAFTGSTQPKVAQVSSAPDGNAAPQTTAAADANSAAAPSQAAQTAQGAPSQTDASKASAQQEKPGVFTRMLTALHLHSKS